MIRTTHTYAVLDVSPAAYGEIRAKLEAADYQHAFHQTDAGMVIDMHGIALRIQDGPPKSDEDRSEPHGDVAPAICGGDTPTV